MTTIFSRFPSMLKPLLERYQVSNRHLCAEEWMKPNQDELKTMILVDDINLLILIYSFIINSKVSVWREPGTGLNPKHITPAVIHGGVSVMVGPFLILWDWQSMIDRWYHGYYQIFRNSVGQP